jgi:tetratricopeptide (TPR) repeat protein
MDSHPDSALNILQQLNPQKYKSSSDKALYDLLLFQATDRMRKDLPPDSLIDFSMKYFISKKDKLHLAFCYYFKGHFLKYSQRYDEATEYYIKALECNLNNQNYFLLGGIYSDMGDICGKQKDYKEALHKYRISLEYYTRENRIIEERFINISIGRIYRLLKDYKTANLYYNKALQQVKDSMLYGSVYQEKGGNFYAEKQMDSAQFYLQKSLLYPYKGTNYSIRCYALSDLLFDLEKYDSSFQYASLALKYPTNFYTQRECYRILVNIEYLRKDIKQMSIYMSHFQSCTDSIRKVELQTKSTVLEKLHNTTSEVSGAKKNMMLIVSVLILVLLLSSFLVVYLYKRNRLKREQLNLFKMQLSYKQEFVSRGLSKKIEEAKVSQNEVRKNATLEERDKLDKELYTHALRLDNWDDFNREMNHAFNNIIVRLKEEYPTITRKEKIWCCLHLLDIPHADRMLLLDATSDSLYKLKQRLAHKLDLKSTKELDSYLKSMTEIKD